MTVPSSMASSAGISRRARRTQNRRKSIRPVRDRSVSSNEVIRNPDSTKNVSTPRNAPPSPETPAWNSTTAATARARTPSSAGW